jgi:protein O-GlcNAc transferase
MREDLTAALTLHKAGDLPRAEQLYRDVLAVAPLEFDAWHLLGVLLQQVGQRELAAEYIGRAIALHPHEATFHSNLGEVFRLLGRLENAAACQRRAIELAPQFAEAHHNLGCVLQGLGDNDAAAACYTRALQIRPNYLESLNNLGNLLQAQGRHDVAEACFRQALQYQPNFSSAWCNLGAALESLGRFGEAEGAIRQAVLLRPDFAEAYYNLGNVLRRAQRWEEAAACFRQTLSLQPNNAAACNNLGAMLTDRAQLDEAEQLCLQAVQLDPAYAEAYNNLGSIYRDQGRIDLSLANFRRAMELQPQSAHVFSNFLFALNYDYEIDAAESFAAHCRWGELHGRSKERQIRERGLEREKRPLRVGYVSPDFCQHPVIRFFEPLLANHDPREVETVLYAEERWPDKMTAHLQSLAGRWHNTLMWSDERLAAQIEADSVDILVDLAGHSAHHRLQTFALRPAPVQVSYLGYPNTTGVSAIDYYVTDAVTDPTDEPRRFTEQLVRLPGCFCCFQPPADAPALAALPAETNGRITFGALLGLSKLNARVLDLWCRLLAELPNSRLLLVRSTLAGAAGEFFAAEFRRRGIADRVELRSSWPAGQSHLSAYDEIDIALDAFPWSGHTTACEALWMGVPVITLHGDRHAARMVASVLTCLEMTEWIAETPEDYVEIGRRWAKDWAALASLRASLRERMRESPLCDGAGFTQGLEAAYREMWEQKS